MMRRIVFMLFLLAGMVFSAAAEESDLDKARKESEKLQKELFARRIDAIRKDPALQKYHEELLEKHREFARMLDSRREIRELNTKLLLLNRRIEQLEKQAAKSKNK